METFLIKALQLIFELIDTGDCPRVRAFYLCPDFQGAGREVLPLLRSVVLAIQVQAEKQ